MPAQAGIHLYSMNFSSRRESWIPASAGMTEGIDWGLFRLFKTFSGYRAIDPRIILASVRIRVI